MQRTVILLYFVMSSVAAVTITLQEAQPALFFINLIAPHPGEAYSLTFVILAVLLLFLTPLVLFLQAIKMFRKNPSEVIGPERTGVFVTRKKALQSAMVSVPIFINNKKVASVDNGKTVFIELPRGESVIQVGHGKQASKKLYAIIKEKNQLDFFLEFDTGGLIAKIHLSEIQTNR